MANRLKAGYVCEQCAAGIGFIPMPTAVWVEKKCCRCGEITKVAKGSRYTRGWKVTRSNFCDKR